MQINSLSTDVTAYNKTANNIKQDQAASFTDLLAAQKNEAQGLISQFKDWKQEYYQGDIYTDRVEQVEKSSASFEKITIKAVAENGYDDPKAFLESLSSDELAALQAIHSLAEPIRPSGLSKEGALNLLYSPNNPQDIDNDGFEMIGLAKTSIFPPPNAPESVKKAWKETTSRLNGLDKMLLSGTFLALPSELGGNAYIPADTDYKQIIQKNIDGIEFGKKFSTAFQRETDDKLIAMLNDFKNNLG